MNKLESLALKRLNSYQYARETHEIVKYSPEHYDSNGHYKKDEWSNFSDIGRVFNHKRFTFEQYLIVEDQYIHVVEDIIKASCITFLTVAYIERGERVFLENISKEMEEIARDVRVGKRLNICQSSLLLRAVLRGAVWCILVNESKQFQISIGYDFYMNIHSSLPRGSMLEIVQSHGLYLDPRSYLSQF